MSEPNNYNSYFINMAELKKDIEFIKISLTANKDAHEKLFSSIDKLENKFASKWVEKSMVGLVGCIMIGVIVALLNTIIK